MLFYKIVTVRELMVPVRVGGLPPISKHQKRQFKHVINMSYWMFWCTISLYIFTSSAVF